MLKNSCVAPLLLLGFLALASQASAQSVPDGSGTLTGGDRLRVPGCGRQGGPVSLDVTLAANGNWTATGSGATYSGTSTAMNGRVVRLTLDAASLAALEAALKTDASALCEEAVTISALNANAALMVNKRQDRARLFLHARGAGTTASGGEGNGLYRLRARGPWTPVAL